MSNTIMPKSSDSSVTSTHVEVRTYKSDDGTTMYSPVYLYKVDGKAMYAHLIFHQVEIPVIVIKLFIMIRIILLIVW